MNRLMVIIITCLICFGFTVIYTSPLKKTNKEILDIINIITTTNNKQNAMIGVLRKSQKIFLCANYYWKGHAEECKGQRLK